MAPEVCKGCYTEKADLWSIGVLLHILLIGRPLFSGGNKEIIKQVINYKMMTFDGPEFRYCSSGAIDLLKKLTHSDPNQRPSAETLLDHVWIKSLGKMNVPVKTVQKALINFQHSVSRSKLQLEVISLFVTNLFSDDEREYYRKVFYRVNKRCDGMATREELL